MSHQPPLLGNCGTTSFPCLICPLDFVRPGYFSFRDVFMKSFNNTGAALISILILTSGLIWINLISPPPLISHPSALRAGDLEVVRPLVLAGVDINYPNSKGVTPLHVVAQEGHVSLAQLLLQNGANLHARYEDLWTPLHLAVQNGHLEMTALLINYGAFVIGPKEDFSPLHFAAQEGYLDIAQLLLTHGANVKAKYQNGWTPLHLAAQEGHTHMVSLLIEHGAPINAMNAQGFTPLHSAALLGRLDSVRTLLAIGATLGIKDHEGQTPRQLALANGFQDVARLLVEFERTGEFPEEFKVDTGKENRTPLSPSLPTNSDTMPSIDSFPDHGSWDQA